ncbi:YobA family protein [Sutcliffiella deserti]|uniref:YobA family protein n=1 Tax=Sutcliffiella deserti TaxID=2875501 RepID=UPI001CBEB218|nr:YobA family protein [Sutcliffiella deserti]
MNVNWIRALLLLLIAFVFAVGCTLIDGETLDSSMKIEGYILEVEEGRILVAENITWSEYEEISEKTFQELDEERISLIYLSYESTSNLKVGKKVKVWIEGGINDSYPVQAHAQKIEVVE